MIVKNGNSSAVLMNSRSVSLYAQFATVPLVIIIVEMAATVPGRKEP